MKTKLFLFLIFVLSLSQAKSQSSPFGMPYQAIARNAAGTILPNLSLNVKIGVYSGGATGTLEWEETDTAHTDMYGYFEIAIGHGISTSVGSLGLFSMINWQSASHFIKIEIDYIGSGSFDFLGTSELLSVPYAFNSNSSSALEPIAINQLSDVDTTGIQVGYLLKWNGVNWIPMEDDHHDTVTFAFNSNFANSSDTSSYSINQHLVADTVQYANVAGSSSNAVSSQTTISSLNSIYSDTTIYASTFLPLNIWSINGNNSNSSNNSIGTIDSVDFVARTRNIERFRVKASGKVGIGNVNPIADLHLFGTGGVLSTGTIGSGDTSQTYIPGTKLMWYPRRGAFRAGQVSGQQWADSLIGNYSFAVGYNTIASGLYSTAFGNSNSSLCESCLAGGKNSLASILHPAVAGGGSISFGINCITTAYRSIAMGANCFSDGGYVFGSNITTSNNFTYVFGNSNHSTVPSNIFGSYASDNGFIDCFIFSDTSSSTVITHPTADGQFVVRATGGVIFYTDSAMTNSAQLFNGGGGWSFTSDRNKKENFLSLDGEDLLNRISKIKIKSWNYKSQSNTIRHIGPFAQDFNKAFRLGESKKSINMVDIDGVNMAAIQALYFRTQIINSSYNTLNTLNSEAQEIKFNQEDMNSRLNKLEAAFHNK